MALERPIWSENTDFFGCGVARLNSARVRVYLDK
jgi:hypothetical protein